MILFSSDYQEGAAERILNKLCETNLEQSVGYGEDAYCLRAQALIKEKCAAPHADVHFLVGGTQTNLIALSAALRPHQGVLSADSGHIAVHETGAIEACGHKVLALPGDDGKLYCEQIRDFCRAHYEDPTHEHMVMPGAVYISQSTELGSIYTKRELEQIHAACKEYGLILYVDGARLGYAMAAEGGDMTFAALAENADMFSVGGTKQGALFGEALVITNPCLSADFRYIMKQKGGMLAKGRLLGLQFAELMEDGLYEQLSRHADTQAMRMREALLAKGFCAYSKSPTNQQFFILPNEAIESLEQNYGFSRIRRVDAFHGLVRFCTSWATRAADVDRFIADIKKL